MIYLSHQEDTNISHPIGGITMKSIKTKYFIEKFLSGFSFIALGIFHFSQEHSWNLLWVDVILGIIIIANFLLNCCGIPRLHFEPVDEMTENHELRAQAATYTAFCFLLMVLGLICMASKSMRSLIFSFNISWTYLFIVIGILQIIEFFIFLWIERSVDLIE